MLPDISIIMPAYNAASYIQQSIDSVVNQSYRQWELIIINDGSTDNTSEIVKMNQANDQRIILLEQQNGKQAAARNNGLRKSRGEWIAFLDSDDIWLPDKLLLQWEHRGLADIIYTSGTVLHDNSKLEEPYRIAEGFHAGITMYKILMVRNLIPTLSIMMNRRWLTTIGFQNESLELTGCEDWEYMLRMARFGANFYGMNQQLFKYRIHDAGTSRNWFRMKMAEAQAKALNIDERILGKAEIYAFHNYLSELIYSLLVVDRKKDALKMIDLLSAHGSRRFDITKSILKAFYVLPGQIVLYATQPLLVCRRLFAKVPFRKPKSRS